VRSPKLELGPLPFPERCLSSVSVSRGMSHMYPNDLKGPHVTESYDGEPIGDG
jgi:hypothetical protein